MNSVRPRTATRKPRLSRKLFLAPLEDRRVPTGGVWTQRGGDPGHTGYADISVNGSAISDAWNQPINYASSGDWDQHGNRGVAIDGNHVYRTELEGYWASGNYHVMAFDLATGAPVWNHIIVGNGPVSAPSAANGYVYVNRSGHTSSGPPYLAELDPQTGAVVRTVSYGAQWESDERPVVDASQVIDYDGYYGGISAWNAASLTRQWNDAGWQNVPLSAALDSQFVYAYNNVVFNRSTGGIVRTVTGPAGYPWVADPMVSPSGKVFYEVRNDQYYPNQYAFSAYTAGAATPVWTTPLPNAPGGEAVGNGVVAVTANGQLFVLDEATGTILKTWTAPNPFGSYLSPNIVLTRTHAFVEVDGYLYGPSTVYAVNLATGQADWSYTNALEDENGYTRMEMAVGGGKLILSHDGFVHAFNLPDRVNQAPDAVDDSATTAEDTPVTIPVLANDTDPDGDPIAVTSVGTAAHGTVVRNADGTVTYTPAANYNGADRFTYAISDGAGGTDTATVSLTITPVNDPPVAAGWQFGTNEDTPLNDHLRASDPDGDPITFAIVTPPAHGTVQLNANDGTFTYTPAADWNGTDVFTFRVNDGTADSNVAQVFVTVRPVNDAPVATDDAYQTEEDTALSVPGPGVLADDTDVDGDPLTAILVSGPSHGSLTLNPNGSFTYTPAADFNGVDSFTYKANDGRLDSNTVTVNLTVNPVNDPPVAANDAYGLDEDTTLTVAAPGLLANDADVDGDPLTAALVSGPAHGSLTLNADGSFAYTPAANYNGSDSFTYKVNDGTADSNPATVSLTINPVNDAPVAAGDSYSTNEDTALSVPGPGVLANDTDVDGDALSAVLVTGPSHGSLALNANGSFTYTPAANYNGADSFTYQANDGTADSTPVTVGLTVNPVPDVAGVVVNQGAAQRSRVTQITVTFDMAVDASLLAGAFTLTRNSDGLRVGTINVSTAIDSAGRTVATLTFAGTGTQSGSLADGRWMLRVSAAQVRGSNGVPMAADYTSGLFRLFGDADGNGLVDAADKAAFDAAYGKKAGQAGYVSFFDFDQDGDIDAKDRNQFRQRLGTGV
jgi:VCBS repeat-containing protein